jgi:lysyl-tRNA synthetase class 2
VKAITAKKAAGINPYPHKFHVSMSLPEYIEKYSSLEPGQQLTDVTVSVAGETGRT